MYYALLDLMESLQFYEGQSKITEPYLITFESSKMDLYLDDVSLQLCHLFNHLIYFSRLFVTVARQENMTCQRGAFML